MNKPLIVVFAWLGLSALPACGSSNNGSSGNTSCVPTSDFGNASDACNSCVEGSCSSEYSALCSANCASNSSSSACTQAISGIGSCIESKCASQCEDSSSAGGSSSSSAGTGGTDNTSGGTTSSTAGSSSTSGGTGNSAGSSSSSAGTGGGGTPTAPNCVTLATCCSTLPDANTQDPCLQAAGFNNDGPCKNLLMSYQAGGFCTGNGGTDGNHVVCSLPSMGICTKTFAPANYVAMYQLACQAEGGQTPDACPTDNLNGCCTIGTGSSASESCYYTTLADGPTASDCAMTTGTWSTTP